jgi:para-aminobenzoate synthetase/4-amino-4-deoxychorismate lyase
MIIKTKNSVILHNAQNGHWLHFRSPKQVIEINTVEKIVSGLKYIEDEVNNRGLYAAGFLSYEAGPAFDEAQKVRKKNDAFPLMWFGLYGKPQQIPPPKASSSAPYRLNRWKPGIRYESYIKNIKIIKDRIARGETYQVNYTYKLKTSFLGNEWDFFCDIAANQQAEYSAFIDTGRYALCSASPELFFSLHKNKLVCRPMKGTAARGCTTLQDREQSRWLASSEKNKAENIMIVDMVRNDLGRIAKQSSVRVPRLFECERFPTVWQMTSTVACTTFARVADIMAALFPSASITGAPKVSTMRIISRQEKESRGVYTGCIGYIAPLRTAQFNVAIRTAVIDKTENKAFFGVGGGITCLSDPADEYEECLIKAAVLTKRSPAFSLLETMLWTPNAGYFLLSRHLRRLSDSASYFGFRLNVLRVRQRLSGLAQSLPRMPHKVRLLVNKNGAIACAAAKIDSVKKAGPVRLARATHAVDPADCFLYHKTTHRPVYEKALAECNGCDDVLLYNKHGEITETCIANVVVLLDKRLITPPLNCGLLGGTLRAQLLSRHAICEGVITQRDLKLAKAIYTINSVRKWREAIIAAD